MSATARLLPKKCKKLGTNSKGKDFAPVYKWYSGNGRVNPLGTYKFVWKKGGGHKIDKDAMVLHIGDWSWAFLRARAEGEPGPTLKNSRRRPPPRRHPRRRLVTSPVPPTPICDCSGGYR